ncbi:CSAD decarboxylase, partial [Urocynchramus pylzowi]|nr:CSAD decarboxylase [Urocynchramus pylzowi]
LDGPGLDTAAGEEFLQEVFRILLEEGVRKGTDVTQKVCNWKEPQELRELLDLELRSDGEGRERLLQRCRDVLRFSVRTGALPVHPSAHQCAGVRPQGTPGASRYTYEMAPVLVLMEEQVLAKLRELVGWSSGDGIFAPGGSISNMLAMNVARFRRFPESRSRGNWDLPRLGLFASQESHYSILKGAALLGIGTDNVHLVRTDERGKMIPEELEKEIQRVKAEVRRGCTPHVPKALQTPQCLPSIPNGLPSVPKAPSKSMHPPLIFGDTLFPAGPPQTLLFPPTRADSVTWNPHKLLMVGLQCSAFLLRDSSVGAPHPEFLPMGCLPGPLINFGAPCPSQGLLQRCHGVGASYLFQRDKFYDVSLDTGDKSPQCGRRADGLKLWILWKAVGTRGLAQRVERAFGASRYLLQQVKRREGFQLVMEPEFINLCFWFIPPSLRGQESSPEFWDKLGKVAPAIKEKMIRRGSMMVGYQPHGSHVNFFRQIITNPAVTRQDLDFFLDEIQELGWDL